MVVEVSTPKKAGKKLRRFAFLWTSGRGRRAAHSTPLSTLLSLTTTHARLPESRVSLLRSASSEGQYRARHDLFTGVIAHFRSSVPVLRCFEFSSCYNDDDDDDDDDNDDGDDGGGVDNDDDDDDDDDD
ncbi:hypothetical protein V1477_009420, partial [Vespula maculifrons]